MTWHHCIRIADILVGIESDCPAFTAICKEMLTPYQALPWPPPTTPALLFQIRREQHGSRLYLQGEELWSSNDVGEILASFEVNLYQHAIDLITPHYCSIHAAAVATGGAAALFAGSSGAGKSSICTVALLNGARYLSDEFALLDEQGCITPFPRPLQWEQNEHPAFTHQQMLANGTFGKTEFSFPTPAGQRLHSLLWLPRHVQHQQLPLRHVILHRYDPKAAAASLLPIRRSEALIELPQHLHLQQRPDQMLKLLNRRIPQQTRFYRLIFSDVQRAWEVFIERREND